MTQFISKSLLALAVLQGIIPADRCILKMAGLCRCEASFVTAESESCCHAEASAKAGSHSTNCPIGTDHKKACCAYTPAHGLAADAPAIPTVDTHQDCIPSAFIAADQYIVAHAALSAPAPHGHDSPQPFDTPLYVRAHSFLI